MSARRGRGTKKSQKNSSRATRASGFEILARESSKNYKHLEIYRNRSRRYDFPRSLQPAPWRCESERSAGTTLTAEGYREPQERAPEEAEGPRNRNKTALEPRKSKDLKYSHVRARRIWYIYISYIYIWPVAPVAQRCHVPSDTLGREFDPGKRDYSQ